ncbi:helix-turn-helix transcriptional regulator [Herbaspirillum frisingense]|nr:helix-turn-helix transcriptional regulator [Herbaspirillum frisingense]
MENMNDRIRQALNAKNGGNQSEMARFVGVSPQAVQKWIAGASEPRGDNLRLTAEYLGVSEVFLRYGDAEAPTLPKKFTRVVEHDPDNPDFIEIKKVKLKLSAGITGFESIEVPDEGRPITFRKEWLLKKGYSAAKLIAVGVKGESMEPTMSDGDTVVINVADTVPKDGEVYAINFDGEDIIKRMVRDFGRWFLVSDNPDQKRYHRHECTQATCIVIGRVVLLQREHF